MTRALSSIHLEKVSKSFSQGLCKTTVLHDVSYTFDKECTYALTGVSGTGKSTLLHLLAGLEHPTRGEIFIDGRAFSATSAVGSLPKTERNSFLQDHVGLLFQSSYLLHELSVLENVMLPGLIAGQSYEQAETHALELLQAVDLLEKANSRTAVLSGGEQQRVALARALFSQPDFILADEPTAHLDSETKKTIIDLLLSCHRQWGTGLIIATHDEYVAQQMDVVLRLEQGTLHEIRAEGVKISPFVESLIY